VTAAPLLTRRRLLAVAAVCVAGATRVPASSARAVPLQLAQIERATGGRIGLAALALHDGTRLSYRADERFAMCSTFKLMLAAAVLARIDAGGLHPELQVPYTPAELLPNSAVSAAHLAQGSLPVAALVQAVIEVSDNTAANLLLGLIGGPAGYTHFVRALGDATTRLDRSEPALNSNLPGDPRDTTTPGAMLNDMEKVLTGSVLSAAARARLLGFMRDCRTGRARLRARLPPGWSAGDKTGSGNRGAVNDLAIFWPPERQPILVACYLSGSQRTVDELSQVHARLGALLVSVLG
jgi:beta-lactamase class A